MYDILAVLMASIYSRKLNDLFKIKIHINILDSPQIRPFAVAIWCGEGKAILNEYLADYVTELKSLLTTGIIINNHKLQVRIKSIICDTLARSYVKGIIRFSIKM